MTQTVTLNNGVTMPMVGFGVFQVDDSTTEQAVLQALQAGYRLLDTAAIYGNEAGVGRAIKASGIAREEIFVVTKLWIQPHDAYQNTKQALADSLARLGLDYVDLYLMHQPVGDVYAQWRAMQDLYREGKARAIGVSNFHSDRLLDLIAHNEIVPAVNQIETHPFYQREAELAFHQEHGIVQQAWGPLTEGKFEIFSTPVLTAIAAKHQKSVAQVVLRWLNQRGIAIIPKSVKAERIIENRDIFDFTLDGQDLAQIATLNRDEIIFNHRDVNAIKYLTQRQ
ncbi:diketogulonate reductase-like aldo/keto reductase [Cricetibacter osteomyelitidis]|uniref:Diketogulonate reductase-like aldo/keto reductase n=1 Tax=Cricetibacter osteomyelitidis TaxID=1521931 RepID=A0A4R2SZP4_9PAST|nr:aldo/keto reductase [Cricetibacter osteomyelitidis]TCP96017.1 diketogulonate reductase-like aldo/keto reductase [Cricetibacter osteomyelitidis]